MKQALYGAAVLSIACFQDWRWFTRRGAVSCLPCTKTVGRVGQKIFLGKIILVKLGPTPTVSPAKID